MNFRSLIVVPARAGSKGLPDKNVKALAGRPLLAWTADAIAEANVNDCLAILSTDSEDYAKVGRETGMAVPFLRPAGLSGDSASAIDVVGHAIEWFLDSYGYLPETVMWLQPTSPFRGAATIRRTLGIRSDLNADAVIGCKEIHRNLTTLFDLENGFMRPLDHKSPTQICRQQTEPLLTPNGAMYLCKTDYLLEHKSFYPPKTVPLVMNAIQSLDIDTEEDWAIAEAFIKQGLV